MLLNLLAFFPVFRWKRGSPCLSAALSQRDCREMSAWKEDTSRIGDGKCSTVSPTGSEDGSTEDSCSVTVATDSSSVTLEEVNDEVIPLLAVGPDTRICIEKFGHQGMRSDSRSELQLPVHRTAVELGEREEPDGHSVSSGSVDLNMCTTMKDV